MTDVALLFPKSWVGNNIGRMPLTFLHLNGYLKANTDIKAQIFDESVHDVAAELKRLKEPPVCIGISCMTGIQIKHGLELAKSAREIFPGTPIVWGGWHPTLLPDNCLENPLVDFVVRGQGERALTELVGALRGNGAGIESVSNLSYKKDGVNTHNPSHGVVDFLKDLKVDYTVIPFAKYLRPQTLGDHATGVISSMGCPFHCGFCSVAEVYKQKFFFRNVEFLLDEIEWMVKEHGVNYFRFDDDNLFIKKEHTRALCAGILERGLDVQWDAGAHASLINKAFDDDTISLARQAGCKMIYIGAESGSDAALKQIQKKSTVADSLLFVKTMHKFGIRPELSVMVSFPKMDIDDVKYTFDMLFEARELAPEVGLRIFPYTPYPGTRMYQDAIEAGFIPPATMEEWAGHWLTNFRGPWTKKSLTGFLKHFQAYYFPYSGEQVMGKSRLKYLLRLILHPIAAWRVRHKFYFLPLDAMLVTWMRRKDF
ncbi:MAG: radical SAM protein [bacterium]